MSVPETTEQKLLDRREFTSAALLALLSGVAVTITACGSSNPSTPSPSGDRTGSITANHGHSAVITGAQLTAGGAVTLDIRGSADHPHTVSVTMTEVGQIAAGQRVSKTSTTDPSATSGTHSHQVTFN